MARNPDLETTAREIPIPMAALNGTRVEYLPAPTAEEVAHREAAGACAVCDFHVKGCWCRWCGVCSRWWVSERPAARKPDADHHGTEPATCPPCIAAARTP